MKNCLVLLLIGMVAFHPISAQFVQIPDATLRSALKELYPECFAEEFLHSTCPSIAYATHLNLNGLGISDPEGLQYFKNLYQLDCSSNYLTHLPELPKSLVVLHCDYNSLSKLPALPDSLIYLECNNNPLGSLPPLPRKLRSLSCYHNNLTALPELPDSLKGLYCDHNSLPRLPILPAGLDALWCYFNALTALPNLPDNLTSLECGGNRLTHLPPLPDRLSELSCWGNFIHQLPSLPSQLMHLECGANELLDLPTLPKSLQKLDCYSNKLRALPTLPDLLWLNCANNYLSSINNHSGIHSIYAAYNCLPVDPSLTLPSSQLSELAVRPNRQECDAIMGAPTSVEPTSPLYYHHESERLMVNPVGSQFFYLLDAKGEVVHQETVNGEKALQIPHLKPGLYYYGLGKIKNKMVIRKPLPF